MYHGRTTYLQINEVIEASKGRCWYIAEMIGRNITIETTNKYPLNESSIQPTNMMMAVQYSAYCCWYAHDVMAAMSVQKAFLISFLSVPPTHNHKPAIKRILTRHQNSLFRYVSSESLTTILCAQKHFFARKGLWLKMQFAIFLVHQ